MIVLHDWPAYGLAHSIISSARASSVGSTSRPIAFYLQVDDELELARKIGRSGLLVFENFAGIDAPN